MNKLSAFAFVLAAIAVSAMPTFASETPSKETQEMALKMVHNMGLDKVYAALPSQMAAQMSQGRRDAQVPLENFLKKLLDYKAMEPELATIYAKNFTKEELTELNTFYTSAVGRKSIELSPKLMTDGMALFRERMIAHQEELKSLLTNAGKK